MTEYDRPTVPNRRYTEPTLADVLRSRPCPVCKAAPGEPCRTKKPPRRVTETHIARLRA